MKRIGGMRVAVIVTAILAVRMRIRMRMAMAMAVAVRVTMRSRMGSRGMAMRIQGQAAALPVGRGMATGIRHGMRAVIVRLAYRRLDQLEHEVSTVADTQHELLRRGRADHHPAGDRQPHDCRVSTLHAFSDSRKSGYGSETRSAFRQSQRRS